MNLHEGIYGAGTYSVLLTLTVSSNVTGRQLQERPLTTAEKHVRAHLKQPKVCACWLSLYRSFLSVSKQQWNPTAAVLSFQRTPTTFPLVPASEVFGPQTPSSQPDSGKADKHSILYNIMDGGDCLHLKHQRITTTLCLATAAKTRHI